MTYQCQYFTINSSISECDHKYETRNAEPEIGTDGSSQTWRNLPVDGYGSGVGLPRVSGSGFLMVLEPNRPGFAVQTRTAGGLPGPVANTKLSYSDFDPMGPASNYLKEVNVHIFGTTLQRHFGWTMFKQVDPLTKLPKYQIAHSPLSELRVKERGATIDTLTTFDLDEASISGIMEIIKRIVQNLQLDADDIVDRRVMLNGDYLTLHNITRRMFLRVDPADTTNNRPSSSLSRFDDHHSQRGIRVQN